MYRAAPNACVQIHVHLLTRGITLEIYIMVYVDKNTLHLPFKIKDNVENKNQIYATHAYSLKPKNNLKISIAVKGQIYVMHQQDCLLSCQLHPTFPPVVEGMWLTEL